MIPVVLATISLHRMAGGLEKNIILLANYFVNRGIEVHLITFDDENAIAFYSLDPSVLWHKLGRTTPHSAISFWDRFKLILRIRAVLKNFKKSILICFHHGIFPRFYVASIFLRTKRVVSERNSITLYEHINQSKYSLGFASLFFAKKITVQFPSYRENYPNYLRDRICVIPNPVFSAEKYANPGLSLNSSRYNLLSVGRLCTQKNQLVLIESFVHLSAKFPDWDLQIVGEGSDYNLLMNKINQVGLTDRIFIHGNIQDVSTLYQNSHLFCLPSLWEGFPNALAEAMSHGLPSVGLVKCAGVKDLILDDISGRLTTEDELEFCLQDLMANPEKRVKMGSAAKKDILRYQPKISFKLWNDLYAELSY